jgi:hypothetical protein
MNLTKAHARYLEPRMIALAVEAARVRLTNSTAPPTIQLPEADYSDMEFFIEQAKIVLPVLGVNLLRSTRVSPPAPTSGGGSLVTPSPTFTITSRAGADATAQEVDGEFTVREGSRARSEWVGGDHSYAELWRRTESSGALPLVPDGSTRVFSRDVVFTSPSAAAAVVLGRTANGRTEWKVQGQRTTYGQWQESLLEPATGTEL